MQLHQDAAGLVKRLYTSVPSAAIRMRAAIGGHGRITQSGSAELLIICIMYQSSIFRLQKRFYPALRLAMSTRMLKAIMLRKKYSGSPISECDFNVIQEESFGC